MKIRKSLYRTIFFLMSLILLAGSTRAQEAPPQPKLQPSLLATPEIIIDRDKGSGRTLLFIRNKSKVAISVSLSGVISSSAQPAYLKISFMGENDQGSGSTVYDFQLEPQATAKVWAIVTDAWTAGDYELELRNNDTPFGSKIKIKNFPFDIKLDGPSPDKAELALVKGETATIILKNNDPISYPMIWILRIDGREVCGDTLTIAPNSPGLLKCQPSIALGPSSIKDLFKNESTEGNLLLLYPPMNVGGLNVSPSKTFPVKASLNYFSLFTRQIFSYLTIVLVLVLGGVTSLFLSQALPNRLKRLDIREQLGTIARTTADLSTNVDSKLQVMLRVERSRLNDLLGSRNTLSPDFTGIAVQCTEGLGKLRARVGLVQQMDLVLSRLTELLPQGFPPTRIDQIHASLGDAMILLAKSQPTDDDLKAAQAAISEASTRVSTLNLADPDFGQKLVRRILDVRTDVEKNIATRASFKRIDSLLPGPFATLKTVTLDTQTIAASLYTSLDMVTEKLMIMRDYALLFEGTADGAVVKRLVDREARLVGLLQPESWQALRLARLLLREMKDDVYPDRLKVALAANPQEASIDMDPAVAYGGAPLEFCVSFSSPPANTAAAREEWSCHWDFGDGLKESGWTVFHYFQLAVPGRFRRVEAGHFTVQASFLDSEGKQIKSDTGQPLMLSRQIEVRPSVLGQFGERSRIETLKLAAALLIAIFGLVAGAQEQLMKLDILPGLIAVFLVGFGADTIKNLLTTKT